MKCIILAGGYARRLWPLTLNRSKSLLPVGEKLIIDHILEKLEKLKMDVLISTNRRFESSFRRWVAGKDVELKVEETRREEEKLGSILALSQLIHDIRDDLLIIFGDNLFSLDLSELLRWWQEIKKPSIVAYDVGNLELVKRYSEVLLKNERVVGFLEKPEHPKTTLIGAGIYLFPSSTTERIFDYLNEGNPRDNPGFFIQWLHRKEDVYGFTFKGFWWDIGGPDSYLDANRFFMKNRISQLAKIENTQIVPPVIVEDGVSLEKCSIGPSARIGKGCRIKNSKIRESVLFDEVKIADSRIRDSIIDERCDIVKKELEKSVIGSYTKLR